MRRKSTSRKESKPDAAGVFLLFLLASGLYEGGIFVVCSDKWQSMIAAVIEHLTGLTGDMRTQRDDALHEGEHPTGVSVRSTCT